MLKLNKKSIVYSFVLGLFLLFSNNIIYSQMSDVNAKSQESFDDDTARELWERVNNSTEELYQEIKDFWSKKKKSKKELTPEMKEKLWERVNKTTEELNQEIKDFWNEASKKEKAEELPENFWDEPKEQTSGTTEELWKKVNKLEDELTTDDEEPQEPQEDSDEGLTDDFWD